MKSYCTDEFWDLFHQLPPQIQKQTNRAFEHLAFDTRYPGLHFKCINKREMIYSMRVGDKYRVLGNKDGEVITWYWIGPHGEYDHII